MRLLLFLFLLSCAPKQDLQRTFEVPIFDEPAHEWLVLPTVKVCPSSPLSVDEVRTLFTLWEQHGAPRMRIRGDACHEREPLIGYVYIMGGINAATWPRDALGVTYFSNPPGESPLLWALISLPTADRKVAAHEIGHVWLGHANAWPHVMFPSIDGFTWTDDGWRGVEAQFFDADYSND